MCKWLVINVGCRYPHSSDHAWTVVVGGLVTKKWIDPGMINELLQLGKGGHDPGHLEELRQGGDDRVDVFPFLHESNTVTESKVHDGVKGDWIKSHSVHGMSPKFWKT